MKEVELKTDVGTLTISDAAWNDMTAKATKGDETASVVIKLEDKSTESSNPVYEVTATVGEENAFDGSGDGAVTISVPYAADEEKGNVKVYCTDDGKMEDMNAALSDGILSWTTSHFSTFEVVAYDGTAEVTYQTMKDGTTSVSSGSFSEALTAVESNGGTITLLKDVTWNAETAFTTAKAVTIQGSHKIDVTVALSNDTSIKTAFVIQKNGGITLDGVTMNVTTATGNEQKAGRNAAFSITNDAKLALVNGAKLNLTELQTGMYMPGTAPVNATVSVSGEGSAITASDIRGNFSNGGQFTVKDGASLTIDDCGSHGLSANKITVDNAALTVKNTGLCGIITTDTNSAVELKSGATVVVEDCATAEDSSNRAAVDLSQSDATLTVDKDSTMTVSGTGNRSKVTLSDTATNNINGNIIGTVTQGEESTTYYEVTFNVTPSDASIVVKDASKNVMSAVNGKYALKGGGTYTYEVSKSGYRTQTGTFAVTKAETISVTLSSSGGGGGSVTTKYTLSFDTNGGSDIAKVTKEKGTTVDLGQYVPTREGYTFAGWYSDEALTQKVTSVKLNGNTTVYAKWTENAVPPTLPFTDVKSGDWFYEAVQYVYDKGMMTGVSADRFAPASTTTRGMIVTILYRLENEPAVSGELPFTDVEAGAWYADAVAWAAANDIVNGTSATTFAPNSPITREQMATMLYRFAQYKGMDAVTLQEHLTGYPDGDQVSDYAIPAMNWAVGQGLIAGMENGTLVPQGSATRAQVATILMRFCENVMQ